ncbi:MAG TPA: phasin family protein [Thermoanaerobaculia bacterium]|jgi:hypothetical protein|nr:phasin family protein [Thermoanaerobaculia bacterium]
MEGNRSAQLDRVRTLHRVILAGLGALVKARQEGGDDLFRELVEKGEKLEALGAVADRSLADIPPVEPAIAAEGREILAYADVLERLAQQHRTVERMIDAMLPEAPLPTPPAVLQARRNAAARADLLREFSAFSSAEVAEMAGSKAQNKAALANRWKQEGRVFSVPHRGSTFFPGYQFDSKGQPIPVISRVLATLGRRSREWELALWFTSANGWLDGRRPVDLLADGPEEVARAAERETEGLFF